MALGLTPASRDIPKASTPRIEAVNPAQAAKAAQMKAGREQAVYINLGVRPSGGYAVKVVSVYEEGKRLVLMKYGVHIVFAIFACSAPMAAEATAQFSDQIVIDGRTEQLFTEPLQDAFRADPELQQNLMSRISENRCTAARRGYVATWEIRANELYLVTVQVDPCSGHTWVPLEELFPGATGTVKATWFSGMLTVPQGNQIEYMHMEYESRYERYLFLDIDKGNVTSSTLTSGPPNRGHLPGNNE